MIGQCLESGSETLESTADAEQAWLDRLEVQDRGFSATAPGYYNNEGSAASDRDLSALHDIQTVQSHSLNTYASGRVMERSKDLNSHPLLMIDYKE